MAGNLPPWLLVSKILSVTETLNYERHPHTQKEDPPQRRQRPRQGQQKQSHTRSEGICGSHAEPPGLRKEPTETARRWQGAPHGSLTASLSQRQAEGHREA